MAYRFFDVKVAKVDVGANKLVIKLKKIKEGKVGYLKTVFVVDNCTLITGKDNRTVMLSDVKFNNRVTIDFMKTKDRKLLAKGISIVN
jgi:Cu/Ag efflux protein CusF